MPKLEASEPVGVDVDLREVDVAVPLRGLGLERGAELAARAAPLRPEVDHHGDLARALDHVALELGLGNVANHAREIREGRY